MNSNNIISSDDLKYIAIYKASGDLKDLEFLYQPYTHLVYGVALKYLKDIELSKDVVMEIFEILTVKIKTQEISNFKSWLYVLTKNHCLMILRKDKKTNIISFDDAIMENQDLMHHEYDLSKELRLSAMEKCLEGLDAEQKISIKLFYLQQKCYADVANETGFNLNKVKSYIQNGKRNLKNCIEKNVE